MTSPRRRKRPDPGIVMVRRTAYGRAPEEREVRVPVPAFDTPHVARVAVGATSTRRMSADFEFMKIEVRVDLPCLPNEEDIRETVSYASALIEELIHGAEPDFGPTPAIPVQRHIPGTPIA